jgi:hypothetical protein
MEALTKTLEIIFQPLGENNLLVRKTDFLIDDKMNVVGMGNGGEYVTTYNLPDGYVVNILAFVGKLFGKAIAADREILCVNWQFIDDKIFASVATAQPFYDADKTRIGQSMPHRQSVELTAKQQKSVMTFIADGFGKPVDDELVNDEINV